MINYRHLLNLRQIAIHNIIEDDAEWYIEKCYRYYSKTYHTPLHVAKEVMSVEEVVLISMQDEMLDLTAEEIADFKAKVNETLKTALVAPTLIDKLDEAAGDDIWIAEQTALLKKQEAKEQENKKTKAQEDIIKKTHEALEKLTVSIQAHPSKDKK